MTPPLLALEGVRRVYAGPSGEVVALDDATLVLEAGDWVAVTGPSGSGKSTLLHVIGLLDTPTAGRHRFGGRDVAGLDDTERSRLRNREIGFVFQAFHLVPHLTVLENVELPLVYRGTARGERRRAAAAALERVGLSPRAAHLPDELSGGEQQRAAVARAVVGSPRLLLADEPTGNLDAETARSVLETFAEIRREGTAVLVVTHDAAVAAAASRRHAMRAGRLEAAA